MTALGSTLAVANLIVCFPLLAIGLFSCYWMTYAWSSPEAYRRTDFAAASTGRPHSFSVIVPVRDESYRVMAATIGRLLAQTHPHVQPILSVGYDDEETLAAARRLAAEDASGRLHVSVSHSPVHNKPTQLNAALAECTGDVVGILDADSLSAPGLVAAVDAAFQQPGVTIVQGGVIMTNYRSSWVALRSSLEYYAHHRSKMHFSSAHGAILMGGNTVFFRRELLLEMGGWDTSNLAEDAEISIRLLAAGHTVTVAYHPELVSREEATTGIRAWVKQRTRWNLGFLQTLRKQEWRSLPPRQRRLTLWHLLQPSLMGFTGIAFPLSVLAFFLSRPPLPIAMLTWAPAAPTALMAVIECVMLYAFSHELGNLRARLSDYLKLIVTVPVYQWMLAYASLRAVAKYLRSDFGWDKTHHAGHHLDLIPSSPALAEKAGGR